MGKQEPSVSTTEFSVTGKAVLGTGECALTILLNTADGKTYLARAVYMPKGGTSVRETSKACTTPQLALDAAADLLSEVDGYDAIYPKLCKVLKATVDEVSTSWHLAEQAAAPLADIQGRVNRENQDLNRQAAENQR